MSVRSKTRIPVRIFNAASSIMGGKTPPKFIPDQLLEAAAKRYGSRQFGDDKTYLEGLKQLCESLDNDSELHAFGRIIARNAIFDILRNRTELYARWKERPEVLTKPVKRPVYIVGPPRTGTTLLFNLLALDDRFRFIRSWEAYRPGLPRGNKRLMRIAKKENRQKIGLLNYLSPDLKKIHHLAAEKPEECIPLLANSFESGTFSFAFRTKSYHDWFVAQDHRYCYAYYRKQLQWMQSKKPGRKWLLKSPAHLVAFKTLFETFPDALVLQTHRDPKKIVPSISSLEYAFQSMVSYSTDKTKIGEAALDYLAEILQAAFEAREKNNYNVIDIQYEQFVSNPMGLLERVYDEMGETMTPSMRERVNSYLTVNPKNKYGKHKYSIEDVGLESKLIHEKFDFYYDRFRFVNT